eukprot:CAMPEP_0113623920 /NCGR_PEP_ID=MMETSP0017_2-20120614/12323_1 /TAXON_ID=2856 /ORGANISM="Cylindrotheca closterium" /LENGTH=833 /DNA_ID=CAMNT_0000533919 /DNA_START=59 /DNA_END=2560 /DNA_ORIENTATION=+ /assembly_acc=CAM_ASM_000147
MISFGTYKLKHEVLEIASAQAIHQMMQHGISQPLLDTAVSYGNSSVIQKMMTQYPNIRIGTKLRKATTVIQDLAEERAKYGDRLYRVLLHKHMPVTAYLTLVRAKAKGEICEIGVSNYSSQQLKDLVSELQELDKKGQLPLTFHDAIPDICQNEFHPFLQTTVPQLCKELGIQFEAHSIHTMVDEYPSYEELAQSVYGNKQVQSQASAEEKFPTAAQLAMAYALQMGGGSVVFNSSNYAHVLENLNIRNVDEKVLAKLHDILSKKKAYARYPGSDTTRFEANFPSTSSDSMKSSGFVDLPTEYIREVIAPQLRSDALVLDKEEGTLSKYANGIPHLYFKDPKNLKAHLVLAESLFLDEETGKTKVFHSNKEKQELCLLNKSKHLLTKIRRKLEEDRAATKARAKPKTCKYRAVEDPEALPVDIPEPEVLQPFIEMIAQSETLPTHPIRQERGVLFPDGRMDFCKQVAQPSFVQLCDAVIKSKIVKHFLIGNNLALANDNAGERTDALVRLINESKGIETYYLAGNGIDQDQIQHIADALSKNQGARYCWFKMNPIKTGSFHLGAMLAKNPRIEVLDLFNTGQEDSGIQAFIEGFDSIPKRASTVTSGLKHLYLDINAISNGKLLAEVVLRFPSLESFFINVNALGDEGMGDFCDHLLQEGGNKLPPLKRLVLGSNGCTDNVLPKLTELVRILPTLRLLQLGSYRSTKFFQHKNNRFSSSDLLLDLAKSLASHCKDSDEKGFFGVQHTYTGDNVQDLINILVETGLVVNGFGFSHQLQKTDYHYVEEKIAEEGVMTNEKYHTSTSKQLNELLGTPFNLQPEPVEYIQSVYRNTM